MITPEQWTLVVYIFAGAAGLYGIWLLIPILFGLPWVPTREQRIRKALQLARVQPGETIFDLGAGDGRVLVLAAAEFGARAIGVEISPLHCLAAWLNARRRGLNGRVQVRCQDFYTAPLGEADVVFAYMTSRQAPRLQPHLEKQLRPGARVVTISFDLPGWQPDDFDNAELIFLYHMPPTPGDLGTYMTSKI